MRTEKHLEIAKDLRLDWRTAKEILMRSDSHSDWQTGRLKAIYSVTEKEMPKDFVKETHLGMD